MIQAAANLAAAQFAAAAAQIKTYADDLAAATVEPVADAKVVAQRDEARAKVEALRRELEETKKRIPDEPLCCCCLVPASELGTDAPMLVTDYGSMACYPCLYRWWNSNARGSDPVTRQELSSMQIKYPCPFTRNAFGMKAPFKNASGLVARMHSIMARTGGPFTRGEVALW